MEEYKIYCTLKDGSVVEVQDGKGNFTHYGNDAINRYHRLAGKATELKLKQKYSIRRIL
jgi:hypothetical protein